jgi:hypothetical protein
MFRRGIFLRPLIKPAQLDPIDRAALSPSGEDGERREIPVSETSFCNVQVFYRNNTPSSQTFIFSLQFFLFVNYIWASVQYEIIKKNDICFVIFFSENMERMVCSNIREKLFAYLLLGLKQFHFIKSC